VRETLFCHAVNEALVIAIIFFIGPLHFSTFLGSIEIIEVFVELSQTTTSACALGDPILCREACA
jgi:hypothetical protein